MASHQLFHQLRRLDSSIIHVHAITITYQYVQTEEYHNVLIILESVHFISLRAAADRDASQADEKAGLACSAHRHKTQGWFISTRTLAEAPVLCNCVVVRAEDHFL